MSKRIVQGLGLKGKHISILKWIGAEEDFDPSILSSFSTLDIEKYFDNYNNSKKSKFHDILSKYLIPISDFGQAKVEDI